MTVHVIQNDPYTSSLVESALYVPTLYDIALLQAFWDRQTGISHQTPA
jgi:hypothetical protein